MNTIQTFPIIILFLVTISCNHSDELVDIEGKWYTLSDDVGYGEFKITSSEICVFSLWYGYRSKFKYDIYQDSIRYVDSDYSAKIIQLNDSVLLFKNKYTTDSLYRLSDSILTYHEIDNKNDSIFNKFYGEFRERAYNAMIKHGCITQEELNNSYIEPGEIKEEIIFENKK